MRPQDKDGGFIMNSTKCLVVLVGLVLLVVCPCTAAAQTASISGVVTDAETGLPIASAEVAAINMDSMLVAETMTDDAGFYLADSLPPGYYIVGANKEGYEPGDYPGLLLISDGETLTGINIVMEPLPDTTPGTISGHVYDQETGLPIDSAIVDVRGAIGLVYTDNDGSYLWEGLIEGNYEMVAGRIGYFPSTYPDSVTVVPGENTPGIDFYLTPHGEPGSISGTITNSVTGDPAALVYVFAENEFGYGDAWSDPEGNYTIPDLLKGNYAVTVWTDAYWEEDYPDSVQVLEGQNTPGIDFELVPHGGPGDGVISGHVYEEGTNNPIFYAYIIAYSEHDNWGGAFSNADGSYTMTDLQPDDYYLMIMAADYLGELYDDAYTWEEATLVTPDADGIDFYLVPADTGQGRITGVITLGGEQASGAYVCAERSGQVRAAAQSETGGLYEISGLSPGEYEITASMVGCRDASYPEMVTINNDMVDGVDIDLAAVVLGDVTGDLAIDISDLVYVVDYMFNGGPQPAPMMSGDLNCDGGIDIADLVRLVDYMFNDAPPPDC